MLRSNLNRVPGRLAFNGISLYSKGGTTIDTDLVYSQEAIEVAGLGKIDNRDKEAYDEITATPDGRMSSAIAAVLWAYNNPTIGAGIFTDTDVPAVVHGNDSSLDTHAAAALLQMPQMIFHPVKTLIGQMKLLCLRGHTSGAVNPWGTANSLRTFADTGGTFVDATYANTSPITQDYTLLWTGISPFSSATDFYDGLVFDPKVEFVDDNVAVHGLFNKRLKSVGGMLRGIPIGATRSVIDGILKIQGSGAVRGASGYAKGAAISVTGADTKVYLSGYAQLIKSKIQNGVEQLREGEVAWEFLPTLTSGVRGAYFTTPMA